jgi:quercetin dioxygenase-like cupin family protein
MTDETIDVRDLAGQLLGEAHASSAGRAAQTVVSGLVQRATLFALTADAEMAEHDSPPAATLHVLSGRVRVSTQDREWVLGAGQLMPVPHQRHSVQALEDSAALLTVALHG